MFKLRRIESIADLRAAALAWDDLWLRSDVCAPTARAELVAQWLEHFAHDARLCLLTVEHEGSLVAALPLVGRRRKGLVEVGELTRNCWCAAGELLVDPACPAGALRLLAEHLQQLPWPLFWFEGINRHTSAWQKLLAALMHAGLAADHQIADRVGWIDIDHDWPRCQARLPGTFRRELRRTRNRLAETGNVEFELHAHLEPGQVEPLLRRAFEVEERSWKGLAGASVLRTPGIFDYFLQQARQLAAWDALDIALLSRSAQPITYAYGYRGKGICYLHKVGYDETCSAFGPGQLLMHDLLQCFHAQPERRAIDLLGPLSAAMAKWSTAAYREGRLVIAPSRLTSRLLLGAYRRLRRAIH